MSAGRDLRLSPLINDLQEIVMNFFTSMVRTLLFGALMAVAASAAAQQNYPNRPIRVIVPFPPGGGVSAQARVISDKLTEALGQPLVIENRAGGNTIIGTDAVAKSKPDGYTLLATSSALLVNHLLLPNLPYDSFKDFAPVATVSKSLYVLVLHPSVPANTLQEFIALAKARPGQFNYSSSGSGGVQHLGGEYFNLMAGIKTMHIPYKGGGPALTDLLGGQVQFSLQPVENALAHIKSGRLKAIVAPGEKRLAVLPEVPTSAEAGLPGFEVKSWGGIFAPAGTPKAIIDRLSTEINRILAMPDIRNKVIAMGQEPFINTPEQFAAMMQTELDRYAKIVKASNIRLEN
jgi:tripartite-type tricarboxylate transporter receptor subunit TctC